MLRRQFKFLAVSFLFLLVVGIITFAYVLPQYVEKRIFPSLGKKLSTPLTGHVSAIGMHETTLGNLALGKGEDKILHVGSVRVGYSISSLLERKIDLVEIDGLVLNLEFTEEGLRIPGLDLEQITASGTQQNIPGNNETISLPVQVDELHINNSLLTLLYKGNRILLPYALQMTGENQPNREGLPVYHFTLRISPQGEEIRLSGSADLSGNRGSCVFFIPSLDLQKFAFLLEEQQEKFQFGVAAIKGSTSFSFMPFQVKEVEIETELTHFGLGSPPVSFAPFSSDNGAPTSLRLKITGDGKQYQVAAQAPMHEPFPAVIAVNATVVPDKEMVQGSGRITGSIVYETNKYGSEPQAISVKSFPELQGDFSFDWKPSGMWQAAIESSSTMKPLEIYYDNNRLTAEISSYRIEGNGSAKAAELLVALRLDNFRAAGTAVPELHVPETDLKTLLHWQAKPDLPTVVSGDFSLKSPGVNIQEETMTGRMDISLSGKIPPQKIQSGSSLHVGGELFFKNGAASDPKTEVAIHAIEGRIPWHWPRSGLESSGIFKIGGISWKKNELGSLTAGIRLKNSAYTWDGYLKHFLPDGLVTEISGRAGITDSGYQANMKLFMADTPFSRVHLGTFNPALAHTYIAGKFALNGDFTFEKNRLLGKVALGLHDGRLEFTEKKYVIENLDFSLLMPSLPDLRSAPAQMIHFAKASIGDFVLQDGRVIWQLESPESIFIEEGVVRWAGGRVFTNSVRLSPDRKEFVVPIFCDRLLLTEILTQAGIKNAEGEGTVSGRIPLQIGRKSIRVEDGFLYSSPGQGGNIKVSAFDMLTAGIPKNTPQFAQVDFAAEALKNFQYNWVRLLLNSEGEDLVMKMHIDGKPMQSLPFRYDSRTGFLQRVENGGQGINQPIRLDVNFRLPLDRLLGYSGKIQDIWNKIK